ncbi:serine/threonine protein kinase [Blastomyces dermatitidis ER-3]|nr:serine/threonine protein kinase [Blastomyces dermatitidis ER-3]OAT01167.1 serine/threonine protein kinase [Blastomyces dermatitidis ER-3]
MLSLGSLSFLAVRACRNRAYLNLATRNLSNCKPALVPNTTLHRRINTMSTALTDSAEYIGQSGHSYRIEQVMHSRLPQRWRPKVHIESMFVFKYYTDHLLNLTQKDLPLKVKKKILKCALHGVAELHDHDIVHTDIKPDNVFIDWKDDRDGIIIDQVKLGDLEDAAHIPPGSHMIEKQVGNWMWRSPEAHAKGPVNKPSDIFSFALVCIYAMHKRVIFAVGEEELDEGVDPLAIVIERQISYFADEDTLNGFLKYLGNNPWVRVFEVIRDGFNKDNPRRPFFLWKGVDNDFKSFIRATTNFDPEKRITAHEALAHKWFEGV